MNPKHLNDDALIESLKNLVQTEREVTANILLHLLEVECRRLFSKYGCECILQYATKELRYTANEAGLRISAMRLLKELPAKELPKLEEKIESGALTVTHLAKARTVFRKETKANKARSADEKLKLLAKIENTSKLEAEKTLVREALVPVSFTKKVEVTLEQFPEALQAKLKRLMDLGAHVRPDMTVIQLIDLLADEALERKDPIKKAERAEQKMYAKNNLGTLKLSMTSQSLESSSSKPLAAASSPKADVQTVPVKTNNAAQHFPDRMNPRENAKTSRYIPSAVRHAVYMRDRGICQNCGSTRAMEVDHIKPHALGGEHKLENLRLLCRSCNQRKAIETYGRAQMGRFLKSPTALYA